MSKSSPHPPKPTPRPTPKPTQPTPRPTPQSPVRESPGTTKGNPPGLKT